MNDLSDDEVEVFWNMDMSFAQYRDELASHTANGAQIVTSFTSQFLFFMDLSLGDDERHALLQVIRTSNITRLVRFDIPVIAFDPASAAFRELCQALGDIAGLKSASVYLGNLVGSCNMTLHNLRHVKELSLFNFVADMESQEVGEPVIRTIANNLQQFTSLEWLHLCFAPRVYHTILPALQNLPKLSHIELDGDNYSDVAQGDAEAIQELFQWAWPLNIQLTDFHLSKQPFHQCLVDGLTAEDCNSKGFAVANCALASSEDGVAFAQALLQSPVKWIQVYNAPYMAPEWTDFLVTMAAGLPTMRGLEELDLQFGALDFASDPAFHDAFLAVIRAAGNCPHLKVLRFHCEAYPELLDKAVAECVRRSFVLKDLYIHCRAPNATDPVPAYTSPALLEALSCNHTVQHISFDVTSVIEPSGIDPWDADMKKNVETVLVLNRSGRAYLQRIGPEKRGNGIRLLGSVGDDLDCVYYHLREYPDLCAE